MVKNYLDTKKMRIAFIYLLLVFSVSLYLLLGYYSVIQNYKDKERTDMINCLKIYQKIQLQNPKLGSLLIENDDYINQQELIEEMSKSTPLMLDRNQIEINKYHLTFKFIKKDSINYKIIQKQIQTLENKEYLITYFDTYIEIVGKVVGGVVVITKIFNKKLELEKQLYSQLYNTIFFMLINGILFLYFIKNIRDNTLHKKYLDKEYNLIKQDTQRIAFEDTLTKAATRLKFDETLKDFINTASRFKNNKFSVIMFDVDNFKVINDTYGHDYGDIVLRSIANRVHDNIRGSDIFARWGGEEFIILTPMVDLEHATQLAQKLRIAISEVEFEKIEQITCSFGVVEYKKEDNESSLVKRADELLYEAKRSGKNKVCY